MRSRTQIVCLHEGERGRSIDPLFIRTVLKALDPAWIRPWTGNNIIRTVDGGGRSALIERMPLELKGCLAAGGDTTLMVWADLDHDKERGDDLKEEFWSVAHSAGITREQFDRVVFVFAKDRLENWIEFLLTGTTDESKEGPRQKHGRVVADAGQKLADMCRSGAPISNIPPSLQWSCKNWRALADRMKS
jgi:hypothetical protein